MELDNAKTGELKNFLEIPYAKLEELNLKAKERGESVSQAVLEKEYTA